jgi:hypothetical protein
MFTVELDVSEIEAYVSHLELCVRDQIPYALSLALRLIAMWAVLSVTWWPRRFLRSVASARLAAVCGERFAPDSLAIIARRRPAT